jgi:two-component system sensor histidine kinase KdpD
MRSDPDSLIYLAGGPLAAILLGMALVPLREATTASNLTFFFLALTIVTAELGGRLPAVCTALVSALSLDFFLTRPYLRLSIAGKHDVVAFFGLAACGLIAAAFGSRRIRKTAALSASRAHLDLMHALLAQLEAAGSRESRLAKLLDAARAALPVAAAAIRDESDGILASSASASRPLPVPAQVMSAEALLVEEQPLPAEGARLALVAGSRRVGWLDVWGNGEPADRDARHALSDLARLAAALLAPTPSS